MPGGSRLAVELGVGRDTVEAASCCIPWVFGCFVSRHSAPRALGGFGKRGSENALRWQDERPATPPAESRRNFLLERMSLTIQANRQQFFPVDR